MQFARLAELSNLTTQIQESQAKDPDAVRELFAAIMELLEDAQEITDRLPVGDEIEYEDFDDLHDKLSDALSRLKSKMMTNAVSAGGNGGEDRRALVASLELLTQSIDHLELATKILFKGFLSHLPNELDEIIRKFEIMENTVLMSIGQEANGFNDEHEMHANYEPDAESRAEDEEYARHQR